MNIESPRQRVLLAVSTGVTAGVIWGAGSVVFLGATVVAGAVYGLAVGLIWTGIWYTLPKRMLTRRTHRRTGEQPTDDSRR
jgi:hypothetical protein